LPNEVFSIRHSPSGRPMLFSHLRLCCWSGVWTVR